MILLFTVLHPERGVKSFWFRPSTLEIGLDFISHVSAQDDQLISVHLIEYETVTQLPLRAFDGQPFSGPMQALESQWKGLLLEAPFTHLDRTEAPSENTLLAILDLPQERIDQLLRRIESREHRLADQELQVVKFEELHLWAQTWISPRQPSLLHRYQTQLDCFQQQVSRSRVIHAQLTHQLNRWLSL